MSPRRSPGDGTLFKRTDGLWVAGFTVDGQRYRVTARNRNDAIRKRRDLRSEVEAGVKVKGGKVKLAAWLDSWLEIHKAKVDPETWRSYETSVRLHIKPAVGNKALDKLSPDDVRDMIAAIQKKSPRAAQKAYTTLRLALNVALADRKISWNPAAVVDKPKHTPKRDPAFTVAEALHIIATAERSCDETWAARWKAGFMTGKREGEVIGLTWDRVDLDNDVLDISWQLQELKKVHGCGEPDGKDYPCGKTRVSFCPEAHWDFPRGFEHEECERSLVWTRPKTKATQEQPIPIIAPLHDVLAELKERDEHNPHNLVFHHPDGTAISQSQDQKAWRRLLLAAGVPHRQQHTLRRTTATLMRAAAVDEQTSMELFGHSGEAVHRIYAGPTADTHRLAMGKLADLLAPQNLDED